MFADFCATLSPLRASCRPLEAVLFCDFGLAALGAETN